MSRLYETVAKVKFYTIVKVEMRQCLYLEVPQAVFLARWLMRFVSCPNSSKFGPPLICICVSMLRQFLEQYAGNVASPHDNSLSSPTIRLDNQVSFSLTITVISITNNIFAFSHYDCRIHTAMAPYVLARFVS